MTNSPPPPSTSCQKSKTPPPPPPSTSCQKSMTNPKSPQVLPVRNPWPTPSPPKYFLSEIHDQPEVPPSTSCQKSMTSPKSPLQNWHVYVHLYFPSEIQDWSQVPHFRTDTYTCTCTSHQKFKTDPKSPTSEPTHIPALVLPIGNPRPIPSPPLQNCTCTSHQKSDTELLNGQRLPQARNVHLWPHCTEWPNFKTVFFFPDVPRPAMLSLSCYCFPPL